MNRVLKKADQPQANSQPILKFANILKEIDAGSSGFMTEEEAKEIGDAEKEMNSEDHHPAPELETGDQSWLDEGESDPIKGQRA